MQPAHAIQQVKKQVLESSDSYATTLLITVMDVYGTEMLTWSPETLRLEIADDFHANPPQNVFDRLLTATSLLTTDDFYKSLPDFINFCNILSGDSYDPETWDPADATEIAWGITEGLLICPPDDDDPDPFSEEIVSYIGQVLDAEGILNPPDVLRIAIRSRDHIGAVTADYQDDPVMFNAIFDTETSKTTEINNAVIRGLQQLSRQLEALPLRNGTTKGVVQRLLQNLGTKAKNGES